MVERQNPGDWDFGRTCPRAARSAAKTRNAPPLWPQAQGGGSDCLASHGKHHRKQLGDASFASSIGTKLKELSGEEMAVLTRHDAALVAARIDHYAPERRRSLASPRECEWMMR